MGAAFEWDFFIAHAGGDLDSAEELYGYLSGPAKVFLDQKCLLLGDDWDRKLAEAQRASMVTLVLVSSRTDKAYYERHEIAAALKMARRSENGHRVVPIYLEDSAEDPYGLLLKHALRISAELPLAEAATQLLEELPRIRELAAAQGGSPAAAPPPEASRISLSIAVDQTPAAGEGDDACTLAYAYAQGNSGSIIVTPQLDYLASIQTGGPIDPLRFAWVPFSWDFPKLDFKILNNSKETVLLSDVVFEVEESKLDPTPVLVIKPDVYQSNALHFRMINEGWGEAVGLSAHFHLTPTDGKSRPKPCYEEPYPYAVSIGDLDENTNVDVSSELVKAGVDLKALAALGRFSMRIGDEWTFENDEGIQRTFTTAQLNAARQACFGQFSDGAALVSGELRYSARTVDGAALEQRVKFWTVVWLYNENRKGKPRPPSYEYATKFRVEGTNYTRQVSISQEVKAGESDRFLVKIGFDKSSRHRFRVRLLFNGGRELVSRGAELHGFAPRSGIEHVREQKPSRE